MSVTPEFFATGGNRNPAAADWDSEGLKLLAFGADHSVALWDPQDEKLSGIRLVLHGHSKAVNAVKFFPVRDSNISILLTGAADHSLRIWRGQRDPELSFESIKTSANHQAPITRISTLPGSDIFATGSSDGTVKIWKLIHDASFSSLDISLLQTITLTPKYFPLNLALATLDDSSIILAVAGTRSTIQIFLSHDTQFQLAATLTGHEGWIRALDFVRETEDANSDLLLASASQDKYIRLWRVHLGDELPAVSTALNDPALGALGKSLSNKAHRIESASAKYSITFEALLLGHEDWIYTAAWRHRAGKLQLLSTSEDNSLAIWESDHASGIWVCVTRLGEISAQKGSTSATGSAGGFWIGLWSPDGDSVVSLGRTGSWRKWMYAAADDMWAQQVAITGHTREVKDVCWSRDGSYLLSTSSDQTTRLFAEWKHGGDGGEGEEGKKKTSWHEFSRPQIHGYDLNCLAATSSSQFLSGADEKLLRVFELPTGVADILHTLCAAEIQTTSTQHAANIPVLGLSNKAITATSNDADTNADTTENPDETTPDAPTPPKKSPLALSHPPFEDHLARNLLWPETEKLYGHGYEISAVATSHSGFLVATACRASSLDHAVIRLYDAHTWLEVRPPLKAHSLTVTSLAFSPDDSLLLSVGRDRQWVVWKRGSADAGEGKSAEETSKEGEETGHYALKFANPKGHSRMILDASWAPLSEPTFVTAGRDKTVKIWRVGSAEVELVGSVSVEASATAVACLHRAVDGKVVFAFGTESGVVGIGVVGVGGEVQVSRIGTQFSPARAVNRIAWRPGRGEGEGREQIAVASDDSTVRIFNVEVRG